MTMECDTSLGKALANRKKGLVVRIMSALLQSVAVAVQSGERKQFRDKGNEIDRELTRFYRVVRSPEVDTSFVAGQLYALRELLGSLYENRASLEELAYVCRSARRQAFLSALRKYGMLRAKDLVEEIGISDFSSLSHLAHELEKAGLIQRDKKAKGASFWLTSRGSLLASEIALAKKPRASEAYPSDGHVLREYVQRALIATPGEFQEIKSMVQNVWVDTYGQTIVLEMSNQRSESKADQCRRFGHIWTKPMGSIDLCSLGEFPKDVSPTRNERTKDMKHLMEAIPSGK